ncbi:hypothetical protein EII29_08065 [Leptotrichia sp. OH3620_COT-345]|uniref:hypothetical protein n=1 Tax=Leptotrichia sp. OH3620_COT-345 TaxID=2491048 RepID=UPI000F65222F|nr:hypothetical protein [Leptotrichia sp. OH3620_COT-345]RRD39188.1 hypothetical protein EII29_08065 [Leptotrichia sp. OH3620_COT-345]
MSINWNFPESNYSQRFGISEAGIETFRGSLFGSLAKEICQNSLDARLNFSEPVIVEFSKFEIKIQNIPGYLILNDALNKCLNSSSDKKAKKFFKNACKKMETQKIGILRASDFNTTGLKGAKESNISINPWQSLIKSSGISDKTSTSGGSYGIGKSAPFACSEIRTIFYTTFDTENILATQGVSRLISFPASDDKLTQGIGYYGETKKNTPIFKELNLDNSFKRKGQTGTDLYIIGFLEREKWKEELISAVLENFLIAIYNKNLIVKVNDTLISKETLKETIENLKIGEKKKNLTINDYYKVLTATSEINSGKNAFFLGDTFKNLDDFELKILYEDLNRKVLISRSNGMKIFDLDRFPSSLQFSAIFTLTGEKLNGYFREMESPQHDSWQPDRHSDENAKVMLKELKQLIRSKIVELGKNTVADQMDADGIGDFLPDDLVFLEKKKEDEKIDKVSDKTKKIELQSVDAPPKKRNDKVPPKSREEFNDASSTGNFPDGTPETGDIPFGINKTEENNLEKEFSIIKDENGFLKVKKISIVSDANIRLILMNKKLRKYKLVILPKKNIPDACVRISLSGEQTNLKAKIRNAYENDNVLNPLRINQDKIYMNNLEENQKFSLSFILNYSDDCSMEVELYEYRV